MARRSAPPNSGPSYLPPTYATPGRPVVENESWFQRFFREQVCENPTCLYSSNIVLILLSDYLFIFQKVFAPEKLPGNFNILTSTVLFIGGIAIMRSFGEAMVAEI